MHIRDLNPQDRDAVQQAAALLVEAFREDTPMPGLIWHPLWKRWRSPLARDTLVGLPWMKEARSWDGLEASGNIEGACGSCIP